MKRFALPILAVLVAAPAVTARPAADEIRRQSSRVVENLLDRRGYMRYGEDGLHYAEACAAMGALRVARHSDNEGQFKRLVERYDELLEPGTDLISPKSHVDFSVVGIIPLEIALAKGNADCRELGLRMAREQWSETREDGLTRQTRWWIDDMYMVGALQIQAYRVSGDKQHVDWAGRFLVAYLRKLQQDNGLFHHGPDAPFFWGRGNGWVAAALAETLRSFPRDHPQHAEILAGYRKMMEALLPLQAESGMWRQLVDREESWEESSATAMFAFAIETGVDQGWLDRERYEPAVDKAWEALVARLDAKANLQDICIGTGQSKDLQYYLDRPRHAGDCHGQAPFLWLAAAILEEGAAPEPKDG